MKKLRTILVPLMALTITSCGNKDESDDNVLSTSNDRTSISNNDNSSVEDSPLFSVEEDSNSYYQPSQEDEVLGSIPQEVLDANVDIDLLIYLDGMDAARLDIGNYCADPTDPNYDKYHYHPEDAYTIGMGRWFATAAAFKKLAPNVRINLKSCSIENYPSTVERYRELYGHLPELMWGTEHVIEMLQKGYCADLNEIPNVANSIYYDSYNEYFMTRFNIGGFQAGLPIAAEPWGLFVNLDILTDPSNPVIISAIEDGECTDEYKEWVDDFTWKRFVDTCRQTNNANHAGLSKLVEYFASYSIPTINDQFVANGSIDISSPEVLETMQTILQYENELTKYSLYNYNAENGGNPGWYAKEGFPEANAGAGNKNFTENQYCTFYAEQPWAIQTLAQFLQHSNESANVVKHIDFLPYPKVISDTPAFNGIAVEGLTIGDQCPIVDGVEKCHSKDSKLKEEVAAYFAMFSALDPRAIEARSKVKYFINEFECEGDMSLPLIKREQKYDWQYDEDILALYPDPAADFEDNWSYQLSLYFDINKAYLTDDNHLDCDNFSNLTYGLYKTLDSMYMIESDTVRCINYWNEPFNIEVGGDIKNIFTPWYTRYTYFREQNDVDGLYYGCIGTDTYVSTIMNKLSEIQEGINKDSITCWQYLSDCVANYYYDENYEPLYPDITDKSYRYNYEGSRFN